MLHSVTIQRSFYSFQKLRDSNGNKTKSQLINVINPCFFYSFLFFSFFADSTQLNHSHAGPTAVIFLHHGDLLCLFLFYFIVVGSTPVFFVVAVQRLGELNFTLISRSRVLFLDKVYSKLFHMRWNQESVCLDDDLRLLSFPPLFTHDHKIMMCHKREDQINRFCSNTHF